MSGTVGIVVNTDKIKDPILGYKDVFHRKHKNRIVVVNDNREMVSWVLDTLGIPINNITPADLDKVRPVLAGWLKLIKVYDSDSPKTALINGDVDLGIVWSGEAAPLLAAGSQIPLCPARRRGSHVRRQSLHSRPPPPTRMPR